MSFLKKPQTICVFVFPYSVIYSIPGNGVRWRWTGPPRVICQMLKLELFQWQIGWQCFQVFISKWRKLSGPSQAIWLPRGGSVLSLFCWQWAMNFTVIAKERSRLLTPSYVWESYIHPGEWGGGAFSLSWFCFVCLCHASIRSVLNFVLTHSVLSSIWSVLCWPLSQPFKDFIWNQIIRFKTKQKVINRVKRIPVLSLVCGSYLTTSVVSPNK